MAKAFTESTIEQGAIDWLKDLGYAYTFGPEIAYDGGQPKSRRYLILLLPKLMRGESG